VRWWREELKDMKATHKRWGRRLRLLRTLMLWHYALLALSGVNSMLALFAVVNTDASWRPAMLALIAASLVLSLYLLFSGLSR